MKAEMEEYLGYEKHSIIGKQPCNPLENYFFSKALPQIALLREEESVLNRSTLTGQIVICILWSLPLPTILATGADFAVLVANVFNLIIPLVVFFVLFRSIESGKGSEFKRTRIISGMFLWAVSWMAYMVFLGFIIGELEWWICKVSGFDVFLIHAALFACYNAIAIALVVKFSYEISNW